MKTKKSLLFKKLTNSAVLPRYAHDGDIGLDVYATDVVYDRDNDVYIYGTGLACESVGHMGVLGMMNSGIYKKGGFYLTNGVGLIDSDQYRGEIKFIYRDRTAIWVRARHIAERRWENSSWWFKLTHSFNSVYEKVLKTMTDNPYWLAPFRIGDKIGQLVPLTFDQVDVIEVNELSDTERGEDGFGSTDNLQPGMTPGEIDNFDDSSDDSSENN